MRGFNFIVYLFISNYFNDRFNQKFLLNEIQKKRYKIFFGSL